jgi:hypothetical protein
MKVTSFWELMREQAHAAVRVSGAHHSSWNGRFGAPIARQSDLGGTANWDNSISYNPRHVDERLQEMFRNARVHLQDKADLRGFRDALRVVLHENVHLLASEGREYSQSYAAMATGAGVRPFEEGVTELYSHQRLDDYIDELGIDQIAPGIKDVKSPQVYKDFTPAVEGFAETIDRRSGVQRDELIGRHALPAQATPAAQPAQAASASEAAPALPPDVAAAARAGLSRPQLTSASRLSPDRQGARGTGTSAPAAQRQGLETQR